jgi:purine-cytosine permease-like protein
VQSAEIGPVPPAERTQSALDLFLIFAGANIVATTLLTGASLLRAPRPLLAIGAGSVVGAAIVAVLVPVGPRLGVPSVIAARAALGLRGAQALAVLLYLTNFAWIALNNGVAASACQRFFGGSGPRAWAVALGLLATVVVAAGPRAVGLADRVAVPVMAVLGGLLFYRSLGLPAPAPPGPPTGGWDSLDVVVGYQVSWILMFADYSRYTRSGRRSAWAVFAALAATSIWFMAAGFLAARARGSADPGEMLAAAGLGRGGAVLMAAATVTTNFVNIYLSALAFRSLVPAVSGPLSVCSIGLSGTALSFLSEALLAGFAEAMVALGSLLVPVGGVLFARFFLVKAEVDVPGLYSASTVRSWALGRRAVLAWAMGALAFQLAARGHAGGSLPAFVASAAVYAALWRVAPRGGAGAT